MVLSVFNNLELVERVLDEEELAKKFYRNHESGNWQE